MRCIAHRQQKMVASLPGYTFLRGCCPNGRAIKVHVTRSERTRSTIPLAPPNPSSSRSECGGQRPLDEIRLEARHSYLEDHARSHWLACGGCSDSTAKSCPPFDSRPRRPPPGADPPPCRAGVGACTRTRQGNLERHYT